MDNVITRLKRKWPGLRFFASQTGGAWQQIDHSDFGAIDPHFWMSQNPDFNSKTMVGRLHLFRSPKDSNFREGYEKVMNYWRENKDNLSAWMEGRIKDVAKIGKKYGVPVGNTEGWGAVFWQDHPLTGWEFIKEAADVSVDLALKHGYKFICTSNFTHPQFTGMWDDVAWHKSITGRIRRGS